MDDYLASIESNLDTNYFQGDEQILQQTVFSFSTPLHVPGGGARDSLRCIGPASRLQFFQSFSYSSFRADRVSSTKKIKDQVRV